MQPDMCRCVYIYIYTYVNVYIYIYMYMYVSIYVPVYRYIYIHTHVHALRLLDCTELGGGLLIRLYLGQHMSRHAQLNLESATRLGKTF